MSWNPRTWTTGELVTATLLNTELRDNLNTLKSPATAHYELNESSNYTTTSNSFVDIDGTKLALTITTKGGDVMVVFNGSLYLSNIQDIANLDFTVDGVRQGGDDGILAMYDGVGAGGTAAESLSFCYLKTGLAAGSHTFKLQWRVRYGSTLTLYAGAGTGTWDLHPQFWVREVS